MKEKVRNVLYEFRNFLKSNGAKSSDFPEVDVRDSLPNEAIAYYYNETDELVVRKDFVKDVDYLLREYCYKEFYRPLYELGKVYELGKENYFKGCSIVSGLGYYLPCSFKGNPFFSTSGRPTLNVKQFTLEAYESDKDERLRAVARGERWAHALWETREELGKEVLDASIIPAWLTLLESDLLKSDSPFDLEKTFIENIYQNIEKKIGSDSVKILEQKLMSWLGIH